MEHSFSITSRELCGDVGIVLLHRLMQGIGDEPTSTLGLDVRRVEAIGLQENPNIPLSNGQLPMMLTAHLVLSGSWGIRKDVVGRTVRGVSSQETQKTVVPNEFWVEDPNRNIRQGFPMNLPIRNQIRINLCSRKSCNLDKRPSC